VIVVPAELGQLACATKLIVTGSVGVKARLPVMTLSFSKMPGGCMLIAFIAPRISSGSATATTQFSAIAPHT